MFSSLTQNGCSYSIVEALSYGTQPVVTPLPFLNEIGITNENALILDFDLKNMKDIVERIKTVKKVKWCIPDDDYIKYLSDKKSTYEEDRKKMKRIKVTTRFYDTKNGLHRAVGDEFEEVNDRADYIVSRGFAVELATIPEAKEKKVAEVAVKEVKKEKAVKEVKKAKKNAKK